MPPTTLDIVVQAWPGRVIERFGFVGYAPTADMIQLTIDPSNPNLAGRFAQQVYLSEPEHYERALAPDRLRELASLADGLWESTDYNHARGFFGASDLPVHAGYTLGFVLTGAFLDAHAEANSGRNPCFGTRYDAFFHRVLTPS